MSDSFELLNYENDEFERHQHEDWAYIMEMDVGPVKDCVGDGDMKIFCRTNLDLIGEKWPEELPCVPRVGDLIQSRTKRGAFRLTLRVVSVVWVFCEWEDPNEVDRYIPYIELHDPFDRSVTEFYKWYAPLVGKRVSYFI